MRVALLVVLLGAGCLAPGTSPREASVGCVAATWDASWEEPGLHAALAAAHGGEGLTLTEPAPPGPPVRTNWSAAWGNATLREVALRGAQAGYVEASVFVEAGDATRLFLGVSVMRDQTVDDALALARQLLEGLGVDDASTQRLLDALREQWRDAPEGVGNVALRVPFDVPMDWSAALTRAVPEPAGAPSASHHARAVQRDAWRVTLEVARLVAEGDVDGCHVKVETGADDHAAAFVGLHPGEGNDAGKARVAALLARAGVAAPRFGNLTAAQMVS